MDACIMHGGSFECGSVVCISDVEHPISLARYALENYPNTIITGRGAKILARRAKINLLSKRNMVAPSSRLAHALADADDANAEFVVEDYEQAESLRSKLFSRCCSYFYLKNLQN